MNEKKRKYAIKSESNKNQWNTVVIIIMWACFCMWGFLLTMLRKEFTWRDSLTSKWPTANCLWFIFRSNSGESAKVCKPFRYITHFLAYSHISLHKLVLFSVLVYICGAVDVIRFLQWPEFRSNLSFYQFFEVKIENFNRFLRSFRGNGKNKKSNVYNFAI